MSDDSAMTIATRAMDKIEAHEKFCEAMARNTNDVIHDMKNTLSTFSKIGVGVLVAISGWALVELYGHLDASAHAAAAVQIIRTLK